ncbi:MAG: GatB/YqeY domain-containing protein [Candidatus Zambryskibacteria bacterium]|nr:GatB/YqeY domain-containing protein [Candidatus Zambryskibacteria bacterium]
MSSRTDLADIEKAELAILETYLPQQMSKEEIFEYVKKKLEELNMNKNQKNQFMGLVMKDLKGRADGSLVKEAVDTVLV